MKMTTTKFGLEAGLYENETIPGLGHNNVVIEGYVTKPGDINESNWGKGYKLGDELTEARMPLIVGNYGNDTIAFSAGTKNNIVFRNLQIKDYKEGGIRTSNVNKATFENIYIHSTQSGTGARSGGAGLISSGNKCKMRHCVVVNSWGNNISISGNENYAQHCTSACLENATDNGTDYYFLTNGDRNKIESCKLIRTHRGSHGGHGFMTQTGNCNQFLDCESTGVSEAIQLIALRGSTTHNSYTGIRIVRGSIVLSTEANHNKFDRCTVDGEGGGSGVQFWKSYPVDKKLYPHVTNVPPKDNKFTGCTFKNLRFGLDFNAADYHEWGEPAARNVFDDCDFHDIYVLIRTQRPHVFTRFEGGSTFARIMHLHQNDGFPCHHDIGVPCLFSEFLEAEFHFSHSTFSEIGFQIPKGAGNTTADGDVKYPPTADIRAGLVGHWTFDEVDGDTVYDSSESKFNGKLNGNPSISLDGKLGRCIHLDGHDDYVDIGDKLDLVGSDITIAAWIKADRFKPFGGVVNKTGNYRLSLGGSEKFSDRISGGTLGPNTQADSGYETRLHENRWYHVAVVLDLTTSQRVKIYVDGILRSDGNRELTSPRTDTGNPLEIGKNNAGFFEGFIDDVRIYNRALDRIEMKALAELR